MLLRNPAIQIIGNRNERERERGVGTTSSSYSMSPSSMVASTTLSTTTTAPPTSTPNTHRPGLATPVGVVGARNKVVSVNEKPEPHQPSLSTAAAHAAPAAAPTLSQNPKEEASSRLEALLRCTSQFSVSSQHDLNRPPVEVALTSLRSNQTTNQGHQNSSSLYCTTSRAGVKATVDCCESFEAGPATSLEASPNSQGLAESESESDDNTASEGKRYRSSIRIMVRPEAVASLQKPIRANSSDGLSRSSSASSGSTSTAKSAKKMSAAGVRISASRTSEVAGHPQRSIVKEQFRYEKFTSYGLKSKICT